VPLSPRTGVVAAGPRLLRGALPPLPTDGQFSRRAEGVRELLRRLCRTVLATSIAPWGWIPWTSLATRSKPAKLVKTGLHGSPSLQPVRRGKLPVLALDVRLS
jgi:hypothetical protein